MKEEEFNIYAYAVDTEWRGPYIKNCEGMGKIVEEYCKGIEATMEKKK